MEQFILKLGIMSLQASVVVCVVLLVRVIFARVGIAKKYTNILWMVPYLCMICPWKFEGVFGFWRQSGGERVHGVQQVLEHAGGEGITAAGGTNFTHTEVGDTGVGNALEKVVQSTGRVTREYVINADVAQFLLTMAAAIWLVGIVGLVIYSVNAHLKLHRKLICSMHVSDNIYIADDIKVPFVMGIFRSRIYLPSGMRDVDKLYVIAHEKTHIRHLDPLKKTVVFAITCVHWFNPLAWAAFCFYGKDMEMACDEATVQKLGLEHKKDYAATLLSLAAGKRLFLGAPLAFDEGNVKSRIKNIVKYKKTWRVLSVAAVVVTVLLAVIFMTEEKEYMPLSKVQDMVHPSKEVKNVVITLKGETRYFAGEGYVEEIADFLHALEIKKEPASPSQEEDRANDVVLEFGAQRFFFDADYSTIWSDSDVKASFSYQVKSPEEVQAYLEGLFVKEVPAELPEPHELTMEELIELCREGAAALAEAMQRIPLAQEGEVYTNLEKDTNDYEGVLNKNWFCYLTYEGRDYRLQLSYGKEDNTLWDIYLSYPAADDMILLYTNEPGRYTVNNNVEEFLGREYAIDNYFTCSLPEGTRLGEFRKYYNDVFSGCPILGDFEEVLHGEYAPEAWYAPGGVYIGENDANNDTMQFENGRAVSVRWLGNHMGISRECESLEGCHMQALLYEVDFDMFTAAESYEYMQEHNLSEGDFETISKYWYVFMGEEDSEYIYIVCLNQAYFTKDDVIALAQSVEITYE